jgi:hypothetical protein
MRNEMEVSKGNHKLGKDTLIFNMGPATECPSRKAGFCKLPERCYAMKAERMYKQSLPYRRRQAAYWKSRTAEQIAADLNRHLERKFKVPITYVRFNESGDFYGQEDVEKLKEIAKRVSVTIYGFTARSDLKYEGLPDNLVINGSSFMIDNSFTAVAKDEVGSQDIVCSGNCRECDLCKNKHGLKIKVVYH